MKKFDRMEAFVAGLNDFRNSELDPCYTGYFECFNRGEFYEAHDVLEHLWLQDKTGPDGGFYKGLIQFAGGYVHLRLQHLHPDHPKHGRRLAPAARLFDLAAVNLAPFAPRHAHLDVSSVLALAQTTAARLRKDHFTRNPWSPDASPRLTLEAGT